MAIPVFYDPQHRRWRRFKRVAQLSAAVLSLLFCALITSVLANPSLPTLALTPARTAVPAQAHQPAPPQSEAGSVVPTPTAPLTPTPTPTPMPLPIARARPKPQARSHDSPQPRPTTANPNRKPSLLERKPGKLRGTATPPAGRVARARPSMTPRPNDSAKRNLPTPRPQPIFNLPVTRATPTPTPTAAPTPTIKPGSTARSQLIGFYVNWDDTSYSSLEENIARLDKLIPEWLHLGDADGTIAVDDPNRQAQAVAYIKAHRPDLPIVPLINNFNDQSQDWDSARISKLLDNPSARAHVIQALLDFVRSHEFKGISIDFENVPTKSKANLTAFMHELYAQFHPLALEVSQSVPVDEPSFDYAALAQNSDYLILMVYDEHWSGEEAGPLASQHWFADSLRRRLAEVSPDQYVIALGNYGYDWSSDPPEGAERSFQGAVRTAELTGARITFDAASLNPTFDYTDENNVLHHVWYLDAVTAFNQMMEAQRLNPRGFALWRLGAEDPSIWQVFDRRTRLDRSTLDALRTLHYGYDLDYEGRGEVLKVVATPRDGVRETTYDQSSGLISAERLTAYPSPYVIMRWGGDDKKKIALTFDDGPSAGYSAAILDVLQRYHVSATFFVIGSNVEVNPQLLQRIVSEGHEVGNHTFTHPDISAITPEQFALELNATERLIESQLGRHSLLFRPPYGEDVEPERPDQLKPLVLTSDLGYYTIGMQIDPNDWRQPGVDKIVQQTIDQAVNGNGNVVLLHDGGGDRTQTLVALPGIIEGLRARGYQLVTISNLLGLSRDHVMPPISEEERLIAGANEAAFLFISALNWLLTNVFMLGIVLGILRVLFIGVLAIADWWKERRVKYPSNLQPRVAVLVPAYNEEKVICKTIDALLASTYAPLEIIVVDDGSTDGTYRRAREAYAHEPRVRVFTQSNGGKSRALNFGLQQTQSEMVVAQDADTIVRPDAISKLVRHFVHARVGAVAGNAKVGNRINLLTDWQALEYITSQNLDRRAFATLNCITVVPGAIGAWRRQLVLKAGGFQNDTLAEDAALTMTIRRMGYQIDYEDEAIGLTEAPDSVRGFLKQRFRWMYGTLQAAWKNRDVLFRPRYGAFGIVALPNILIFQIFFPLISPLMDLLVLASLLGVAWQRYQHPLDPSSDALTHLAFFYALFLAVDFFSAFLAFLLERKEDWSLLVWLFFQRFLYRQLMYYVAIKSTLTAIRGTLVGWGKLERKATVSVPAR